MCTFGGLDRCLRVDEEHKRRRKFFYLQKYPDMCRLELKQNRRLSAQRLFSLLPGRNRTTNTSFSSETQSPEFILCTRHQISFSFRHVFFFFQFIINYQAVKKSKVRPQLIKLRLE